MLTKDIRSLELEIDRSRKLAQMIEAGEFQWVHPEIVDRDIPIIRANGIEKEEVVLFPFNKVITIKRVKTEMKKEDCIKAGLTELLAVAENCPGLLKEFPIAVFGSMERVFYISHHKRLGRILSFRWETKIWDSGWCFLGVRNK